MNEILWEEKNLIELKTNYENKNVSEINDITINIKKKLNTNEWKGIGTTRNCPKCNTQIVHRDKYSFLYAIRDNKLCKSCVAKNNTNVIKTTGKFKGVNNPFYGKHHCIETIKKLSVLKPQYLGKNNPLNKWLERNVENRITYSKKFVGIKNGMFGRKHTKEALEKISFHSSGKNNPMYGKPTPQGSGNGWANWYKGFHFRSLRELQYYITEIEGNNLKCENAQCKFSIPYKNLLGYDRTYKPDFLVNDKYIIEIKPEKLWNTKTIQLKKEAAEKFCKENNLEYKLIDIKPNSMVLREKYLNGEIKFVEKYKEKFEKYANIK